MVKVGSVRAWAAGRRVWLESGRIEEDVLTRPFRPQINGKVERYQRTLTTEWAYTQVWTSDQQREDALGDWLHQYNYHRYHTAIDGPPISRVNNLRDQYI